MKRFDSGAVLAVLVLVLGAWLWGLPAGAVQEVRESRAVAADATIHVSNVAGRIEITGWERNEVDIVGILDDDVELEITGGGKRLNVEVELPERVHHHEGSADLKLRVPVGAELDVSSVSADISVSGFTGTLRAESVSADVRAEGRMRDIEIHTVSGEVLLPADAPRVTIEAVSSDIHLGPLDPKLKANVSVQTVSGDVTVDGVPAESDLQSVSGDVVFQGDFQAAGHYDFSSHSGDIRLTVPPEASARFSVTSFSGEILNGLGSESAERTSRFAPGVSLDFSVGDGDARVTVETFSGDVILAHP